MQSDSLVYTHTHFRKQLPMSKIRSLHASNSCRKYLKARRTASTQEHKKKIKHRNPADKCLKTSGVGKKSMIHRLPLMNVRH